MIDLSLHILDVASNAFKAQASLVKITIKENSTTIQIWIEDNGCGMSQEVLSQVTNPFYTSRTTRKVGLGLPLFKQTCEQTGGFLEITSQINQGTMVHALMYKNHIDAIPMGNLAESLFVLIMNPYNCDVAFEMNFEDPNKTPFVLDTREIKEVLDGVALTENAVSIWLKEYIEKELL